MASHSESLTTIADVNSELLHDDEHLTSTSFTENFATPIKSATSQRVLHNLPSVRGV